MNLSILHLALELAKKICERADHGDIRDLDIMAEDILNDCKETSRNILQVMICHMNKEIREDKEKRKELGLVIKEKDRPRSILTALGQIKYDRDYFYDRNNGSYVMILDQMLGIKKRERVGSAVAANLVSEAADVSYAKATDIVTGGEVSRQTVHNLIRKMDTPEIEWEENKKNVKELHIYADEDHAHMQKPGKEKGKKSKIIPLVTVTEGMLRESARRNKTIHPVHFSDKEFDTKKLWKSVEGFIDKGYEMEELEKIYIHGDGGGWIKKGLETFPQTIHVMDGFHFYKELRKIGRMLPERHPRVALINALKKDDKRRVDEYAKSLLKDCSTDEEKEKVKSFTTYLLGNWEEIRRRIVQDDIPGSCTEGLVSHVLSERFSRDPLGWSEEALGKLVMARIYLKNGGKLKKSHFQGQKADDEKYSDYADMFIEEHLQGAIDYSMFEPEHPTFNRASGTQIWISNLGKTTSLLS